GFGTGTAERRALPKKKPKIFGALCLAVNRVRCIEESSELDDWRNLSIVRGEEWAIRLRAKAKRSDARGIVKGQHVVEILVRLPIQDLLADGAADEHSPPAVGATILDRAEERRCVVRTRP